MPVRRRCALVAGAAYLMMTVIALATQFDPVAVLDSMDPTATGGFWPADLPADLRVLLLGSAAVVALDVVLAVAMVPLFPRQRWTAQAMGAARMVYATGYALALLHLLGAVSATADTLDVGTHAAALEAARAYRWTWDVAFFAFGVHLVLLGRLLWSHTVLRKVLAVLLVIAGAGYFIDSTLAVAAPHISLRLASVLFVGEMTLMIWLLAAAGRPRSMA